MRIKLIKIAIAAAKVYTKGMENYVQFLRDLFIKRGLLALHGGEKVKNLKAIFDVSKRTNSYE